MPLIIIGNAKKSHSFKGKAFRDLGFDFHSNENSWMTGTLFFA